MGSAETATLAAAESYTAAFLDDLQTLVNIDSGSYTPAGVEQVAAVLRPRFEAEGCAVQMRAGERYGPQLIARRRGTGHGRVLLIGHMDTVFADNEAVRRPFSVRDGRAYGPGVFDMKSGLLVVLYALRLLNAAGEAPYAELLIICNADEEIGSPESTAVIEELARETDLALVFEPTSRLGRITASRKGVANYTLSVSGLSSHAGVEPQRGRNAIVELAHRTLALHALNGTIPGVTLNVGVVRGGQRPNVVPDTAAVDLDIRMPDGESMRRMLAALQEVVSAPATVAGTTAALVGRVNHEPFTQSAASVLLLERADAVARALGFELRGEPTGGASDGNTTAGMGLPTLDGMGLVGGMAHNPGEYIEVSSIAPRVALLAGLLRELGAHPLSWE